ncbi:hypothetical protein KC460_03270 [Candidatus Dependentiae bacterium]|nr:hypothetical protein [Candidatus Dependentiae bacterium]
MNSHGSKFLSFLKILIHGVKKCIWNELLKFCIDNPDLEYVMIGATIVRAYACSEGYEKQNEQGIGRSVGGFTSKIHAKVDALGNPLQFLVTPGQSSDVNQTVLNPYFQNAYVHKNRYYHH